MAVDRRSDRPVYAQIADELRKRIKDGVYLPDSKLPSETDLINEYGFNRLTIRKALSELAKQGLTEAQRGRGVFVRRTPVVMRLGNTRFSREARRRGKGAFAAEAERLGLPWAQEDQELSVVEAPAEALEYLGEPMAVMKKRLMILDGKPFSLADSYIPLSLAQEIGYDKGANAPGGIYGLLEQHGHSVAKFKEIVGIARHATPEESVALEIPMAAAVQELVRLAMDPDCRVLEYFDSVEVGDRAKHVYEFDAPKD